MYLKLNQIQNKSVIILHKRIYFLNLWLSKSRLSQLSSNESTKLRADELYLIALAIDVDPSELLNEVCKGLKLPE